MEAKSPKALDSQEWKKHTQRGLIKSTDNNSDLERRLF